MREVLNAIWYMTRIGLERWEYRNRVPYLHPRDKQLGFEGVWHMNPVKRLLVGTVLEKPLRHFHRHLTGAHTKPPVTEWDLREARDNAYLRALLPSTLEAQSNCVDVGAHRGSFLRLFLEFAPAGRHYAFEPIPALAIKLRQEFPASKSTTALCPTGTVRPRFSMCPSYRAVWLEATAISRESKSAGDPSDASTA